MVLEKIFLIGQSQTRTVYGGHISYFTLNIFHCSKRQKDKTQVKQLRQSSPITYISKYTIEHISWIIGTKYENVVQNLPYSNNSLCQKETNKLILCKHFLHLILILQSVFGNMHANIVCMLL